LKRTLYAIIGAFITLLLLYPLIANAYEKITRNHQTVVPVPTNNGQGILRSWQDLPKVKHTHNELFKPFKKLSEEKPISQRAIPAKPRQETKTGMEQSNLPASSRAYNGRHYSKEEVIGLIEQYAQLYRINSNTPLCIAQKESGYNQFSANKRSSARGVFQYLSGTWAHTDEGKSGLSVFDASANVKAAVKYMAIHKSTKPWVVRNQCPPLSFL
jgi:hypothetical protein